MAATLQRTSLPGSAGSAATALSNPARPAYESSYRDHAGPCRHGKIVGFTLESAVARQRRLSAVKAPHSRAKAIPLRVETDQSPLCCLLSCRCRDLLRPAVTHGEVDDGPTRISHQRSVRPRADVFLILGHVDPSGQQRYDAFADCRRGRNIIRAAEVLVVETLEGATCIGFSRALALPNRKSYVMHLPIQPARGTS